MQTIAEPSGVQGRDEDEDEDEITIPAQKGEASARTRSWRA
jgi:hypothetical protein